MVVGTVSAATTISTNIVTEGTLSVTGTSTLMGNVGIGTSTPNEELDVYGEISFIRGGGGYLGNFGYVGAITNSYYATNIKSVNQIPTLVDPTGQAWYTFMGNYPQGYMIGHLNPGAVWGANVAFLGISPSGKMAIGGAMSSGDPTNIVDSFHVASSTNATTTIQIGKSGQNKGSCLVLYDDAGTAVYAHIATGATAFTLSYTSCR